MDLIKLLMNYCVKTFLFARFTRERDKKKLRIDTEQMVIFICHDNDAFRI